MAPILGKSTYKGLQDSSQLVLRTWSSYAPP